MLVEFWVLAFVGLALALGSNSPLPELRCDLQKYQDGSRCYPDPGLWYLMYRNYYADPDFGGSAKCVRYRVTGTYENFSTSIVFMYGEEGMVNGQGYLSSSPCYTAKNIAIFRPDNLSLPVEVYNLLYVDCDLCTIKRHPYVDNGHGCTLWRKADTLHLPADGCEFIYDQNCGTSPKYKIFDETCPT
ncbi:uncharacterized protein LOC125940188 [Dermacentor silvarum]|uniref:uncharacterized protein LOC125940188 n=1 Tax=Dermacentor silvarum TaxID=543639 RepID=UPI002100CFE8|nr:uncharacterized protein LOC125940188 [Dermacentor silvarum]